MNESTLPMTDTADELVRINLEQRNQRRRLRRGLTVTTPSASSGAGAPD